MNLCHSVHCGVKTSSDVDAAAPRAWLLKAEKVSGVPKQDGSLFHAYRRAWATARKHLSLKDVAAAGGWKRTETLMRHYIQADAATMLQVLDEPLERQA